MAETRKAGEEMLKIGEFAKICNVNVQTLRYYDKIGVLCADRIDQATGYRYYSKDKIKTFQLIEQLKQLDFSLEEIKQFLACTPVQQCRIYRDKKDAIMKGIHKKYHQIGQIDVNCKNTRPGVLPLNYQMLQMPFEDDPRVIGKWTYCGDLAPDMQFCDEQTLTQKVVSQTHLYFLPGGCNIWMYFWSKDYLYFMLPDFNVIVPNAYRVFCVGDVTYMELNWMVDIFLGDTHTCTTRIYRQEDTRAYTERETYVVHDDLDVPYVPDECVLGKWETVDIVRDPDAFRSKKKYWQGDFWIVDMEFLGRGVCVQTRRANGGLYQKGLEYSAGIVLDRERGFVQHYRIFIENQTEYLIMEHKSGDYCYKGTVGCYYVFKRKEQ